MKCSAVTRRCRLAGSPLAAKQSARLEQGRSANKPSGDFRRVMKIVGFERDRRIASRRRRGRRRSSTCRRSTRRCRPISAHVLARLGGDLNPASPMLARKAPASARRPLRRLKYALPVAQSRQDRLSRPQLSGARQGRPLRRQRAEISQHLLPLRTSLVAARGADRAAARLGDARLRGEMVVVIGRPARHLTLDNAIRASPAIRAATTVRCANFSATPRNGTWARISTRSAKFRPVDGDGGRIAARRQGA